MISVCNKLSKDKIVVAKERGKKFIINNNSKTAVNKVRVDKCFIKESSGIKKCDYLFELIDKNRVIYVELKGNKIEDAIKQLEATIYHTEIRNIHKNYDKESHIVASKVKRAKNRDATSSANIKMEFKRKHKMQLFISTIQKEIKI